MHHPDMPAANALPDIEQQLSELKQEKLREWKAKSATHRPDPDYAHRNDTSMAALLMEPETLPLDGISDPSARVLFEHKSPTVKAIREQLARIGVHKAWLIDSHIEHLPNGKTEIEARGAILELPADPAIRKKAFLKIATSYVDLEFDAPQDNGQRYELVNLI